MVKGVIVSFNGIVSEEFSLRILKVISFSDLYHLY